MNVYGAIVADPPWDFRSWSPIPAMNKSRSANYHYVTLPLPTIKAFPVRELAMKNCALFLWTTDPFIPRALEVMQAWGFVYSTVAFHWIKTNRKAGGFFTGCGWWTRANPEICLLGTRGSPKRLAKDVKRLIVSDRREHSRKPDEAFERIRRLVAGPYVELFSRQRRDGWDQALSDQPDMFA